MGTLLHCGKLSRVAATALSGFFSDDFKGQNTGLNNVDLFKCNSGLHLQLSTDVSPSDYCSSHSDFTKLVHITAADLCSQIMVTTQCL